MKKYVKIFLFVIAFIVLSKLLSILMSTLGGLVFTGIVAVAAWLIVGKLLSHKGK